jgi:hypothetical protein
VTPRHHGARPPHGTRSTPHDGACAASHGDRSTRVGGRHPTKSSSPVPRKRRAKRSKRESHPTSPSPADAVNAGGAAASPPAPPSRRRRRHHGHGAGAYRVRGPLAKGPDKPAPLLRPPINEQTRQATAGIARNSARPIHADPQSGRRPARHAGIFLSLADRSTPRILFFPFLPSFLPPGLRRFP